MRFRLLALMQLVGGLFLIAFAAFPTPTTPRATDLVLGIGTVLLALVTWLWLPSLPTWALHISLVATTAITALLVYGMPSDQGQVFASYGFVLVSAFAGTFFEGRALAAQLGTAVVAWVVATALNPQLVTPLVTAVVAVIIVMLGASFAHVTVQAREAAERTRAVWQSQIDPMVILEAVRDAAGITVDLRFVEANDAAVADLGVASEDVIGRTVLDLLPGQIGTPMFTACTAALDTGEPVVAHALPVVDDRSGEQRRLDVRAFRAGSSLALTWADVTEQARAHDELMSRARVDDLTGFLSRRTGLEALEESLRERRAGSAVGAVLYCDLDGFKEVNDRYGHEAGDLVLREVADRVRGPVRAEDVVVRLGGDEFLVVLLGPAPDAVVLEVAGKVRRRVGEPIEIAGAPVEVGMSIGIARPRQGEGVDRLVARADEAMYEAKRSGRGRVVVA